MYRHRIFMYYILQRPRGQNKSALLFLHQTVIFNNEHEWMMPWEMVYLVIWKFLDDKVLTYRCFPILFPLPQNSIPSKMDFV